MTLVCFTTWVLLFGITSYADGATYGRRHVFKGIEARIKGGKDSKKGEYPWHVGIFRKVEEEMFQLHCSGSILSPMWILSAAHCFSDPNITLEDYDVIVGEYNLTVDEGNEQRFHIAMVLCHGDYNISKGSNDIALIKVEGNIEFDEYVKPITLSLPEDDEMIEGNSEIHCITTGWGNTDYDEPGAHILKALDMPLLSLQDCKDAYNNSDSPIYEVTEDMMCTGYTSGNMSACYGDSGGPLACDVESNWTLVGLVSWGKECGSTGYPELFVRVSYFYDWIIDVIYFYS